MLDDRVYRYEGDSHGRTHAIDWHCKPVGVSVLVGISCTDPRVGLPPPDGRHTDSMILREEADSHGQEHDVRLVGDALETSVVTSVRCESGKIKWERERVRWPAETKADHPVTVDLGEFCDGKHLYAHYRPFLFSPDADLQEPTEYEAECCTGSEQEWASAVSEPLKQPVIVGVDLDPRTGIPLCRPALLWGREVDSHGAKERWFRVSHPPTIIPVIIDAELIESPCGTGRSDWTLKFTRAPLIAPAVTRILEGTREFEEACCLCCDSSSAASGSTSSSSDTSGSSSSTSSSSGSQVVCVPNCPEDERVDTACCEDVQICENLHFETVLTCNASATTTDSCSGTLTYDGSGIWEGSCTTSCGISITIKLRCVANTWRIDLNGDEVSAELEPQTCCPLYLESTHLAVNYPAGPPCNCPSGVGSAVTTITEI